MYYTYIHRRADDFRIFYVGKGLKRRPYSKWRSKYWHNVANKHGVIVQIMCAFENEQDAIDHEVFLIKSFRDLKQPLVNLTDGGEGRSGLFASESQRGSKNHRFGKPIHPRTREALILSLKTRKLSQETKELMALKTKERMTKFAFIGTDVNTQEKIIIKGRSELAKAKLDRKSIYRVLSNNKPYKGYLWEKKLISDLC
jgi:hypothetical protein